MGCILKYGHIILVTGDSTRPIVEYDVITSSTWNTDSCVHINTCPIIMRTANYKNFLDGNWTYEDRGIIKFVSP